MNLVVPLFSIIYRGEMEKGITSLSSVPDNRSEFGNIAKISQDSMFLLDVITLNMPNTHPNSLRSVEQSKKGYRKD